MAFLEKRYEEIRFYRVILVSGRNRASAQNGYRAFAEAGYGALTGDKAGSVYQASTSHGILRDNVFIGAGAGCRYSHGRRSALLVSAFFRYAYEPGNLVTDDSDYMEGAFPNIGLKLAIEL